jgi:hypothetical protein
MKMPAFFRTPSHRIFDLNPRYYDAVKERQQADKKSGKNTLQPAEQAKARIKDHFGNKKRDLKMTSSRQTLLRVALIAGVLSLMIYWMFS